MICQQLRLLRKASHWQLIQILAPSANVWPQCDIRIFNYSYVPKNFFNDDFFLFSDHIFKNAFASFDIYDLIKVSKISNKNPLEVQGQSDVISALR